MTLRRLPRELGITIACERECCEVRHYTGNIRAKVNRKAAAGAGWARVRPIRGGGADA